MRNITMRNIFLAAFLLCGCGLHQHSYQEGDKILLNNGEEAIVLRKVDVDRFYIRSNAVSYRDNYGIWRSKYDIVSLQSIRTKI